MESHLLQMRGLKLHCTQIARKPHFFVASFTDAWIETQNRESFNVKL